ncbi:MAG TPA: DUF2252 family protein [Bryobacteraceae bacterium]|nr:DUF2252 family protein [Bryobacteraceae bacterium]
MLKDVRSAVDALLKWHRPFRSSDLLLKLQKMTASPFRFFRGTFFLYAADLAGPFRDPRPLDDHGRIVGDVHTENYGTFRSIGGEIVYDINDFDEATSGLYELDIRRLSTSLILSALEIGHTLGDGLNAAEGAVRAWIEGLHRGANLRRKDFEAQGNGGPVRALLSLAQEKSRAEFLKGLANEAAPGQFVFRLRQDLHPVTEAERKAALRALPMFLKDCLAPRDARPGRYRFQDIAARTAGNGSLGRVRYAVLLDKGQRKRTTYSSLRLMEWKQALDSAYDSPQPHSSRSRAKSVFEAMRILQVSPKRYLGYTRMLDMPMQAREWGANDQRFAAEDFRRGSSFQSAAALFGSILARCHLLGTPGKEGPRRIPLRIAAAEGRYINRILQFSSAYAEQMHLDHEELLARRQEVERAWKQ